MRTANSALPVVLGLALLSCDGTRGKSLPPQRSLPPLIPALLEREEIPFRFFVPGNFAEHAGVQHTPRGLAYHFQLDSLDGIMILPYAPHAMSSDELGRSADGGPQETHSGVEMRVVESRATSPGEGISYTRSYLFPSNDRTWQLTCYAAVPEGSPAVDSACAMALSTLKFKPLRLIDPMPSRSGR
jgi:hypothetical protein